MKISGINLNNYNYNNYLKKQGIIQNTIYNQNNDDCFIKQNGDISFTGNLYHKSMYSFSEHLKNKFFRNAYREISTIKDYMKLPCIRKEILRYQYSELEKNMPDLKFLEKTHLYVAQGIKKIFDERFGDGKYTIILIGRSLATYGVALESLIGKENLVNLPMSNVGRFNSNVRFLEEYEDFNKSLEKDKGLNVFRDFLNKRNLSKESIKNSGKSYILMDYVWSGNSLKGAEQLFNSDFIWGSDNKNVYVVNFMKLIQNIDELRLAKLINLPRYSPKIFKCIEEQLCGNYYKQFSRVRPSFYLEDISYCSQVPYNEERNLVIFNLIDKIVNSKKSDSVIINKNKIISSNKVEIQPVQNQKVEIWQDAISSYESDLRNEINNIRSVLIKLKNDINTDSNIKEEYNKAMLLYKKLCRYYSDLDNLDNRVEYYQNKK